MSCVCLCQSSLITLFFFFQAEDGIRDIGVTGVQTCALPISWIELVKRCEASGVDGFELNFSCPHGLPERKMGAAMGQDPDILEEVCGWVKSATNKPVWAKMTPNITHIEDPSRAALRGGATGLSAINTIRSVVGVNLDTLRPEPSVEGYTTPGGYSCKAVQPIALRMV